MQLTNGSSLRFVDLSVTLEDVDSLPKRHQPRIEYSDHESESDALEQIAPGVPREAFLEGKTWASEQITLSTHSGTHMDAPWHYHPTMNSALETGKEPAASIEAVPLDWCIRPGVKLDFRAFPEGYVATAADVEAELARIGYELAPLDIVLVNTRAAALYNTPGYWQSHCGMGREATLYLLERGVRVVGTDAWSWDVAFKYMSARYRETGDASCILEGHKAGAEIGYYQMEKMTNLDQLPPFGFSVICLPVKIKGASAGWTRAVATFNS